MEPENESRDFLAVAAKLHEAMEDVAEALKMLNNYQLSVLEKEKEIKRQKEFAEKLRGECGCQKK